MRTFAASMLAEQSASGSVIAHARYQNYDCAQLGRRSTNCAVLMGCATSRPPPWSTPTPTGLPRPPIRRALIHHTNLAREQGRDAINADIRDRSVSRFRHGMLVALSAAAGTGPGERKARVLLEARIYGPARSNRTSPTG
jgi:hypothetical protein